MDVEEQRLAVGGAHRANMLGNLDKLLLGAVARRAIRDIDNHWREAILICWVVAPIFNQV